MKKLLVITLSLMLLLSGFTGCAGTTGAPGGETGDTPDTSAGSAPEGTLQSTISPDEEYIVVNCMNAIEYFNAQKYGWEMAGKLFNVKVSFMGPADTDMNEMGTAFDSAIAKKPAGIVCFAYDPAMDPYIVKAEKAGIPVVTYVGFSGEPGDTYIGTSQYDLGYQGAKLYADTIGGKGKVAILTISGSSMFEERNNGFKDGFAEFPGIEVVALGDTKADSTTAVSTAKDIAIKYPDLTGFVCADSTGAAGAATALSELGLTGKIDILGLDRNTDVLQMVKDGTITGALCQNDVSMAYWAMISLITKAHVDIPLTSDNEAAGAKVTPNYIYTSVNLVTKDNVDYYLSANEEYAKNGF
ncbi:MAG TPA: substrate-binding domain-containing protein [Anaerovoracaceae bacterium]|nr:substrate-binding domain-containing protein [Anaerovoracaceae bacterium]